MKIGLGSVILLSMYSLGCVSKDFKQSERLPQSTTYGTGSIGSGTVDALANSIKGISSVVSLDLNEDGKLDRAVLMSGLSEARPDEMDLLLILSAEEEHPKTFVKKNVAWTGRDFGTFPTLHTNLRGSLVIKSANESTGRFRWSQELTVLLKNEKVLVIGFTHHAHDTIEASLSGSCDINLLSQKGVKNGKSIKAPSGPIPLSTWSQDFLNKVCELE